MFSSPHFYICFCIWKSVQNTNQQAKHTSDYQLHVQILSHISQNYLWHLAAFTLREIVNFLVSHCCSNTQLQPQKNRNSNVDHLSPLKMRVKALVENLSPSLLFMVVQL